MYKVLYFLRLVYEQTLFENQVSIFVFLLIEAMVRLKICKSEAVEVIFKKQKLIDKTV